MHFADISGYGKTKAAEHWKTGLVELAAEAGEAAISNSGRRPTAIVTANTLGGALGDQRNLPVFVSDLLGIGPVETHNVEADEASGGAAIRLGLSLICSGFHEEVLVIGAEKATDTLPDRLEAARANGLNASTEASFGFSAAIAAAVTMRRYIETHGVKRENFYEISALSHRNAAKNPEAFFGWPLSEAAYRKSPIVAEPITVCDTAPPCDGSAAVLLSKPGSGAPGSLRITGSSMVSGRPGIERTAMELTLPAARDSALTALRLAQTTVHELSLIELHDSSTVMAALSLEALGLCEPGQALELAASGNLDLCGKHPCWTFGGLKARGNTLGASGVYQLVEASQQLLGCAKENQVPGKNSALIQCLGSFGATAVTHVLTR